ncbi:MAG: acyl-CoA dehydrogenase family protein [Myxococcota bacterium]
MDREVSTTAKTEFRDEVRAWLESHCPAEMRTPMTSDQDICWGGRRFTFASEAQESWLRACAERGFTVPTWPKEYGGAGLSGAEATILAEELRSIGARPPLVSFGIAMLGPALLHFGTDEQKATYLPPIARGEVRWCQGYSEPGSGSDLASLATRAEEDGDEYVITGQKIWTSYADKADWIFCLVRTDASTKHRGISFVLFDMDQPGVDARPISLISGKSPFCEVFFEGARAKKSNCVGGENQGWSVAKTLLAHERQSIGSSSMVAGTREWVVPAMAKTRYGVDAAGRLDAPILRSRIAQLEVDRVAFEALVEETQAEYRAGRGSPTTASLVKYYGAELNKRKHEMLMSVEGLDGLAWEGAESDDGALVKAWLRTKANSIEGGTNEIQLNILAKHALGLPGA